MALSDLKKKHALHHQKRFTIDEFIEDAELYARGTPKVVSLERSLTPTWASDLSGLDERRGQTNFHKATFTLTRSIIEELNDMMQDDGLNKSHLVRLFTRYFATLTQEERQLIYERMGLKLG